MQVQGINSSVPVTASRTTTRGFGDLKSEDFMGLLIAELQNQDPLKPTDNQQLLSQMSSIRQMEQSATLNQTLANLAGEQRFSATAGLMGHYVFGTVTSPSGNTADIEGIVIGVEFDKKGGATLELHNGQQIPATDVQLVTLVQNLPPEIRERLGLPAETPPVDGETPPTDDVPETPPDAADDSEDAGARRLVPDEWARGAARTMDSAAWLVDRLFMPGVRVGI